MSSANDNNSTLKAAADAVSGTVQSVMSSITGSTADKAEGEAKQDKASAEYDASKSAIKLPGATVSSSGVAKDDPDRAAGSWNQTVGSAKEAVGGVIGSQDLKTSGRQQNLQGQEQEAKGQIADFGEGVTDRVIGTAGSTVASLTGNKGAEAEYQKQHDIGKTQQRGAEADIQKKTEAEAEISKE